MIKGGGGMLMAWSLKRGNTCVLPLPIQKCNLISRNANQRRKALTLPSCLPHYDFRRCPVTITNNVDSFPRRIQPLPLDIITRDFHFVYIILCRNNACRRVSLLNIEELSPTVRTFIKCLGSLRHIQCDINICTIGEILNTVRFFYLRDDGFYLSRIRMSPCCICISKCQSLYTIWIHEAISIIYFTP